VRSGTAPALLLAAAVAIAGAGCQRRDGPEPIAFDRESCAYCRMLISDPAFAAQLRTEAGEVLDFDDPGCLMRYRQEHAPRARAVWYHHLREQRWLREAEAGFVPVARTPMGWGLGAVDAGSAGARSLADAEAIVRARAAGHAESVP
jgi:copper chaperone NosL